MAIWLIDRRTRAQAGAASPVSAREVAQQFGLPLAQTMKTLKQLAQARLLASVRGAGGGYVLTTEPERISLGQVLEAIEGPVRLTACAGSLPVLGQGCEMEPDCPVCEPLRWLHQRVRGFFEQITLAELFEQRPEWSRPETEPVAVAASAAV